MLFLKHHINNSMADNEALVTSPSPHWNEDAVESIVESWALSESEQDQLQLLKERLSDIEDWKNTPDTVVRFLRARPGDVNAAEVMFRNMIQWRKDNAVDTILQEYDPPTLLKERFPGAVLEGVDKERDPIYVGRIGKTDAAGFLERFGEDEMVRHAIWIRELISRGEWIKEYEVKQGRPVKRITIIEDLEGLSLIPSRGILKLYGKIMHLDQQNYCETAKRLIILRAPLLFRAVWTVVKHFFDPGVVEKMVFTSSSDYQKVLDKYIDRDVLPPCICAEGKGKVAKGLYDNLEGGKLPDK